MSTPSTTPTAKGFSTSEGKLAAAAMVMGLILEGSVLPVLSMLRESHPEMAWIAVVLPVLGVLLQVLSFLGYAKSRTVVKVAALTRGAQSLAEPSPSALSGVLTRAGAALTAGEPVEIHADGTVHPAVAASP